MDLKKLQYFLSVAQAGSFAEAARHLNVGQPALSAQIARLEEQLGVTLLERSPRGVTLTEPGRVLQAHASTILAQVDRVRSAVRESARGYSRDAAIGMPSSLAALLGVALFAALNNRQPPIRLSVYDNYADLTEMSLRTGKLNCAVATRKLPPDQYDSRPFASERLFVIQSATQKRPVASLSMDDLGRIPLVLPPVPNALRATVQNAFDRHGAEMLLVGEFRSLPTLLAAVTNGIAATILPVSAVSQELAAGNYVATPVDCGELSRDLYICTTHADTADHATTSIVVGDLIALARRLCTSGFWPNVTMAENLSAW